MTLSVLRCPNCGATMQAAGACEYCGARLSLTGVEEPRLWLLSDGGKDVSGANRTRLIGQGCVVGRETPCDLYVADSRVSHQHFKVEPFDGGFRVVDLGSVNGTYVNGHKIAAPTSLKSGDEISAGGSRVVFEHAGLAAAAPKGPRLVILREDDVDLPELARRVQPLSPTTRIGRSRECEIFLDDVKISHHHATIELRPDGVFLVDTQSTNGTYLHGHRVQPHVATPLREGDEITIGRSKVRFEIH